MTHEEVVHGVESVGVDYGVYRYYASDKKLLVIVGNKANAELISEILNDDWYGNVYEIPNREAEVETMEWIVVNERYKAPDSMFKCSKCGEYHYVNDNYCPGCGRKYRPKRKREKGIE